MADGPSRLCGSLAIVMQMDLFASFRLLPFTPRCGKQCCSTKWPGSINWQRGVSGRLSCHGEMVPFDLLRVSQSGQLHGCDDQWQVIPLFNWTLTEALNKHRRESPLGAWFCVAMQEWQHCPTPAINSSPLHWDISPGLIVFHSRPIPDQTLGDVSISTSLRALTCSRWGTSANRIRDVLFPII